MAERREAEHGEQAEEPVSSIDIEALGIEHSPRTEILRPLGEGGMGRVEAVLDHVLGRTAAKKSLQPEHESNPRVVRRFVREARITSQLDHPSVVPVHDLGIDASNRLFFTLKMVEGRTLYDMIDTWRDDGVDEDTLLDVLDSLVKVCDALSLAHSRGVIHCDVKPENIMIGDYGETYLMDWGAALVLPEPKTARPGSWLRRHGNARPSLPGDTADDDTIGGTPNYMAPEQATGDADLVGPRTDVFGVGATLYEVLTGRSPYADIDEYLAIEFAAAAHYSPLEDLIEEEFIPPLLAEVISKSMARDVQDRYESVDALKAELVRYLRGGGNFPVVRFAPGAVMVEQGAAGDRAYIITRGHCDVVKDLDGQRIAVRRLGPGEVFGETALLSPGPRTATVVAVDEVSAQVIHADILARELQSTRPWLGKLIGTVADRFREVDAHRDALRDPGSAEDLARRAVMFLFTWGELQPDGSRVAAWSALGHELAGDDRARCDAARERLERFGGFRVDLERDRVSLSDPDLYADVVAPGQSR